MMNPLTGLLLNDYCLNFRTVQSPVDFACCAKIDGLKGEKIVAVLWCVGHLFILLALFASTCPSRRVLLTAHL